MGSVVASDCHHWLCLEVSYKHDQTIELGACGGISADRSFIADVDFAELVIGVRMISVQLLALCTRFLMQPSLVDT